MDYNAFAKLNDYIVLRTERVVVPDLTSLGPTIAGPGAFSALSTATAENLEISTATLTKAERDELRRDPRTQAIATPMPLSLLEPIDVTAVAAPAAGGSTWGVDAVGALGSNFDGDGVVMAVLDTGIDPNHPAFAGVDLVRRNFTNGPDGDQNGHGTHCAGTILGRDVDGLRIGVAPGIQKAVIGKVLGPGGGSSQDLVEAIQWSVENGANVVSMSLGIDFPGFVDHLVNNVGIQTKPATSIALEQYRANINLFSRLADLLRAQNGVQTASIIVAASGNESERPNFEVAVAPPAAGTGIIAVGALKEDAVGGHSVADFSNTQCNISAPGVDVISAVPGGGLASMSGTSMATPHVAGIAALWAQKQMQESGSIDTDVLTAQLLAMADRSALAPGMEREDVGEGLVKAP